MSERPISEILVEDRHRRDLGDLVPLSASIREHGLLHPVVITDVGRLIAGQRRLAACRLLGWSRVPVTVIFNLSDAALLLTAERDENTCRLDMTPSEKVALGRALEDLHRPDAEQRSRDGRRRGGRGEVGDNLCPTSSQERKTATKVGAAVGMSPATYNRAKHVVAAAEAGKPGAAEVLERMDATGKVTPAYNALTNDSTLVRDPGGPYEIKTDRQRQVANKSRDRLWGLISHLPDSDSLSSFDVRPAIAAAADEDKDNWVRMLGDSIKALRELRTRIQEAS